MTSVHHGEGTPRQFIFEGTVKELSIFIDESGDFGQYKQHCPYYIVTLLLHEQEDIIDKEVNELNLSLGQMGFKNHTIHTGPLIRQEKVYSNMDLKLRYNLFNKLFHFTRKVNIKYQNIIVNKKETKKILDIIQSISKQLSLFLKENYDYFTQFDKIIVYYDNGQLQLTNILMAIFSSNFGDCFEFRPVFPNNYRLFQTADFICTLSLIEHKLKDKVLTNSEKIFFGSKHKFNKNYLKHIKKLKFHK